MNKSQPMSPDANGGNKFGLAARLHRSWISQRRARVLSSHLAEIFEKGSTVLDVGCGYGLVSRLLCDARPDLKLTGIDIVIPDDCLIEARPYDGKQFPFSDKVFEYVQFVDVLHHTTDPMVLLREATRVARRGIIIKDHQVEGMLAWPTLWFLDWAGNKPYDVGVPFNFWSRRQWVEAFATLGVSEAARLTRLGMYAFPFNLLFDRSLHFIDKLALSGSAPSE